MNPRQAVEMLEYLVTNQKTVVTGKLKEPVEALKYYNKILQSDNNKLRKRIKRQQNALRRLNGEN